MVLLLVIDVRVWPEVRDSIGVKAVITLYE